MSRACSSRCFSACSTSTPAELAYTNAGHNPPLLIRRGAAPAYLPASRQLVVGAMSGTCYRNEKVVPAPGDRLLLYTDGVTEVVNPGGGFYSEARLASEAGRLAGHGIQDAAEGTLASVQAFADGAEQSDDITIMLVEYRGAGEPSRPDQSLGVAS